MRVQNKKTRKEVHIYEKIQQKLFYKEKSKGIYGGTQKQRRGERRTLGRARRLQTTTIHSKMGLIHKDYTKEREDKKMNKKIRGFIERIIAAENQEDAINNIFYGMDGIERAEQKEEISFRDSELLLKLIEKMA